MDIDLQGLEWHFLLMEEQHFKFSSYREKLIEHIFVSELLKLSWKCGDCSLEIAKPEVDNRGYDLIIERGRIVRHIQLKASHLAARAVSQKIHIALAGKPSGCVIWIYFDEHSLELGPFLYFGGDPGQPLPDIFELKVAKHVKANSKGFKAERRDIRVVPRNLFSRYESIEDLYRALVGP